MDNNAYQDLVLKYGSETAAGLYQVDLDIHNLFQQAQNSGMSLKQIRKAADPLIQFAKRRQSRWKKWSCVVSVIVAVFAAVLFYEPSYRVVCAYSRLLFIKTLPYWDWTVYYKEDCLISNPFYEIEENNLYEEDCEACNKLERIERLSNVSQLNMSDTFLKRDIPVIITDATNDWPAKHLFTLSFLRDLYDGEELLRRTPPCYFSTSVHLKNLNIRKFLMEVHSGQLTHWYALWENCDRSVVRLMRRFYRRPYFIPPMVEAIDRNWIMLSSAYSDNSYKPLDITASMVWMAQLQGENKIRLIPRNPCNVTCSSLYAVLHEGETVVWTDFLWILEYLPIDKGNTLNVAILSGGSFD